jgi:hypothetical protein
VKVETPQYAAFCRRVVRALSRRVAEGDEPDLAEMVAVMNEMEEALGRAVAGMREHHGRSWAYIAAGLGCSRQNAQKRFAKYCTRGVTPLTCEVAS